MKFLSFEDLKKAAEERMAIFDNLPDEIKDVANEHGLRKALIIDRQKREHSNRQRTA